ncbi:chemotaxis protein CheA [Vibrio sp. 1180_3]|uniref:chemotaxis protein CheA n=1 Tax=Vibrio sp. 1180_3 TaxID=2528832 RepID=UPI0024064D31|nr:chemotaxis protein CheA [Vibrio sp. 1180_3]MDF9398623.1 chemotaxis protein CheA [Vibrio sp. 1180_3]
MALDMEMLRKMFYEECRENLEVLESVLLNLDPLEVDSETINTIFRAAHSIKGGAATFNLLDISEFTHSVEAYLDLVRNEQATLTAQSVDILLKGGDCIRNMLEGHESGIDVDHDLKQKVSLSLQTLLSGNNEEQVLDNDQHQNAELKSPLESHNANTRWEIVFSPHQELFFSGNDPLRLLRELKELDEQCIIEVQQDTLPELAEIEAELCYLGWTITLNGGIDENDIREIFEWVEDQCDLAISRLEIGVQMTPPHADQPTVESSNRQEDVLSVVTIPTSDPSPKATKAAKPESSVSSIRVDIDKVDSLINLVGELVITQSMLTEIGNDFSMDKLEKLKAGLAQLLQNSKDLQENVLNIRMLPMSFAFSRFPRLVRDLCGRLEKKVELNIVGENTELDKTVLERIVDPLVHLVRNGIDHGIEQPQIRLDQGKVETGTIELHAYHQGGSIIVEVKDDGAGIDCERIWQKAIEKGVLPKDSRREDISDKQILNLIFAPGFSTAEQVSDISGRGVGMDVVKRNIEELGGHIEVESTLGKGSHFTISLPLTLAILDGQLVKVGGEVYIIPLLTIIESIQINHANIKYAAGGVELYRLREENIPILRLQDELEMGESGELSDRIICFVEAAGNRVGLLVDELLDQQQVVIKSLDSNYSKVSGISGATILGDGSVSLILDIQGLISAYSNRRSNPSSKIIAA